MVTPLTQNLGLYDKSFTVVGIKNKGYSWIIFIG